MFKSLKLSIAKLRNRLSVKSDGVGQKEAALLHGCYLPIGRSNESLASNELYLDSAKEMVQSIEQFISLDTVSDLLDFGCGQGRLANGLKLTQKSVSSYLGIDTDINSVNWCKRWIESSDLRFSFVHLNAKNDRYNPAGGDLKSLPLAENSVDLVFLNSVFSHMLQSDVEFYLTDFSRVLKPGGGLYFTAFIEENVPLVEENPGGYLGRSSQGVLHRVRYEKDHFMDLLKSTGFEKIEFKYREISRTEQSVVFARKLN